MNNKISESEKVVLECGLALSFSNKGREDSKLLAQLNIWIEILCAW